MFQFQPKQFYLIHLTWVHMLLLLLQHHHVADAQSTMDPVPTYMSHHNWEPSFAITVGAIIFALLFLGIISIYIRNCVGSRIIITQSNPTCSCSQGINKELLNTFPVLLYSTIKHLKIGKGALECAVCLIDFKDNDTLRLLPKCNHVFHPQCIDSWLASHVTCPVCRANLYQDSCQVSITVTTLLSTDQMGVESPETHDAEENQTDPRPNSNPDLHNLNEGEGNGDGGVASKLKLLRSNSTGHSLVEEGKCMDRYTLTLPEDVRRNILVNNGGWRSASYHNNNNNNNNNVVKGLLWNDNEGSSRGKRNNGEGRVERWVLCTPPFVARRG